ncbi:MAG: hypothetical protein KDC95_16670 [Planctomycetes bacterium]|nr:hypothetical protein [Planctomycetota bacterium]
MSAPVTTKSSPARAIVLASAVPIVIAVATWFLAPTMADDPEATPALRMGGLIGAGCGLVVALLVGVWTYRACQQKGSAFLAPLAFGFLLKAAGLALGTWLVYTQIGRGAHIVFAFAFVAAVFGFGLVATPRISRQRVI